MEATNLSVVCVLAFVLVFVVLSLLSGAMYLITILFPARVVGMDAAVVAAVSSTVETLLPGARVTRIEEEQ